MLDTTNINIRITERTVFSTNFFNGAQVYTQFEDIIYFAPTAIPAINKIYKYNMSSHNLITDNVPVLSAATQHQETQGTGCVTYKSSTNTLFVIGGFMNDETSSIVQYYSNDTWESLPGLVQARMEFTCHYWSGNNLMYAFGGRYYSGSGGKSYIKSIESFNLSLPDEWLINQNELRGPVGNLRSVIHEKFNKIIIIGGFDDLSMDSTYIFDPENDALTSGPNLSMKRANHLAIYDPISTYIYIFGGWNQIDESTDDRWTNTIEKIFIATDSPSYKVLYLFVEYQITT